MNATSNSNVAVAIALMVLNSVHFVQHTAAKYPGHLYTDGGNLCARQVIFWWEHLRYCACLIFNWSARATQNIESSLPTTPSVLPSVILLPERRNLINSLLSDQFRFRRKRKLAEICFLLSTLKIGQGILPFKKNILFIIVQRTVKMFLCCLLMYVLESI